ncbi:hypothetical protein KP509_09G077800 [Ceratopteris richardii]|uniref:Uncharacterized protein n=1 Tax=Ceratopteris richardii TaxID=49495 RepID=A0A8T2U7W7_CERRI|nr:hypothetical protein KP509_09G077800 [Ceratopteris richardii]
MAIDVDQALRTLRLPPPVSYNSLAENVKAELRRRVALNCGPNLQPVTCPVCLSSSFIKFRYFNNRNALGKLPARFQCSNPQTCRDIEFTLHPGLGPPVIAQRCLPMVAAARSSIQSVKGTSTERPDLTARVAVPGKGTVQVGNKRTGTGKTKNVISSSRPSAALRDGASMSCVKGKGMSATDSSNVTCGRLEERRRSELSDQVFDRVSSHPGQRNQISTQRFAQNKGTGTTRSTDPKRKLQGRFGGWKILLQHMHSIRTYNTGSEYDSLSSVCSKLSWLKCIYIC